ncbi:hypothetical protein H0H87_012247, partial [Tephrocybe sp. NHM501043]
NPDKSNGTVTGAIVGGIIGGLVFLSLIAVTLFLWYRRRKHLQAKALEAIPLTHDLAYIPPADNKRERLQEVISEKALAQRQRDELRTNLGATRGTSDSESEARLKRQVEVMSERILQLEQQQRDIEMYQEGLFGSGSSQPPPGYSVTSENGRSTA